MNCLEVDLLIFTISNSNSNSILNVEKFDLNRAFFVFESRNDTLVIFGLLFFFTWRIIHEKSILDRS